MSTPSATARCQAVPASGGQTYPAFKVVTRSSFNTDRHYTKSAESKIVVRFASFLYKESGMILNAAHFQEPRTRKSLLDSGNGRGQGPKVMPDEMPFAGYGRAPQCKSLLASVFILPAVVGLISGTPGFGQLGPPSDGRVYTARIRTVLENYVRQGRFGGFYDFQEPGRTIVHSNLEPAKIDLPASAWPRDEENGFGAFLEAIKELSKWGDRPGLTPADRRRIFSDVLKFFEDYPFLGYQSYYRDEVSDAPSPAVPNNIFVQYMSRRLLLAALAFQPGADVPEERRVMAQSLFPANPNGRAGAALLERHGVLLAGFGVRADVDAALHQTPLVVKGWKSTKGSLHGGGVFDYSYFSEDYIAEVSHLLDLIPKHLISGGATTKPLTSITCHGYNYIYEMEDFARKFFAADADSRSWLGYLHGQTLNVFGLATVRFSDGVSKLKFRTQSVADGLPAVVPVHGALLTLVHEVTHYLDATIAQKRPDYAKRLRQIIELGVRERSNIRAIDSKIEDFAGSGQPAYAWFRQVPQEMAATAANVVSVDPLTVLDWCKAISQGSNGVAGPLNHFLWFVDAHSLDKDFRETEKSFLLTLQPEGIHFSRIDCQLKRNAQGRIETLSLPGRQIKFDYDKDGFAHSLETAP